MCQELHVLKGTLEGSKNKSLFFLEDSSQDHQFQVCFFCPCLDRPTCKDLVDLLCGKCSEDYICQNCTTSYPFKIHIPGWEWSWPFGPFVSLATGQVSHCNLGRFTPYEWHIYMPWICHECHGSGAGTCWELLGSTYINGDDGVAVTLGTASWKWDHHGIRLYNSGIYWDNHGIIMLI